MLPSAFLAGVKNLTGSLSEGLAVLEPPGGGLNNKNLYIQ